MKLQHQQDRGYKDKFCVSCMKPKYKCEIKIVRRKAKCLSCILKTREAKKERGFIGMKKLK